MPVVIVTKERARAEKTVFRETSYKVYLPRNSSEIIPYNISSRNERKGLYADNSVGFQFVYKSSDKYNTNSINFATSISVTSV